MVKKGWGFRDLGTFKSDVSHKWFNEVSTLIEIFLCTESDGYPLKLPKFAILGWHRLAQAHGQPDCQILKYQVDFLLPLKLQKYAIFGFAAKYSWPISLQDFLLLLLLVNLNNGGSLLHCVCWFGKMWIGFEANHGDT